MHQRGNLRGAALTYGRILILLLLFVVLVAVI